MLKGHTKKFWLTDSKEFEKAERFKAKLENKGYNVTVKADGLNTVTIEGTL